MTFEDFYVRCNDGIHEDEICCPYTDCHWSHGTYFNLSLGEMISAAREHLEEKHP